ncbi:MAG: hypothetical protein HY077_15460 [Elusimicrobia bacterium]|nr:hypothetical protein [Elusimicrobiota bacterium]
MSPSKRLSLSAWAALALHLVAGLSMLLILSRGLQTNGDLADRLQFLMDHRWLWALGWLPWTMAGASILVFYSCFAQAHSRELGILGWLAVCVALLAVACDWTAQGIEVFVLPGLAARAATASFLRVHREAVLLTGGLANGLYTAAAGLLLRPTRSAYPRWTVGAGWGVVAFGAWLTAASLADSTPGLFWSNAGLVPCLMAWLAGTALSSWRREG